MECNCNRNIHCTVTQCAHNANEEKFCTLNAIHVGTHEMNPSQDRCTDCLSFERK